MTHSLIARSISFVVAALMSSAILGGIDQLSQPNLAAAAASQLAQTTPTSQG